MIDVRPFDTLGRADHGWLDARHHFSFASYYHPDRMSWGRIRVWNDDTIAPQSGFPAHPHRDMEIITFIRDGALSHQDSLGNEGRIAAGDVQVMTAGTGIMHAEYNREDEPVRLFQIWIETDEPGVAPHWGERHFPTRTAAGAWEVMASGKAGDEGSLPIRADARILAANLEAGQQATYEADAARYLYLVASDGAVRINDQIVAQPRDGVAISGESRVKVEALGSTGIVMVDSR